MWVGCASDKPSREAGVWHQDMSDPAQFHRAMGRTYMAQRNWGLAASHLRESLRHDSDDAATHVLLGIVQREQGLSKSAEASFLTAIDLYDRIDRHGEAERLHRRALELDPEQADYHNNLGFSLYLRGRWVDAVSAYQTAIRLGGGPRVHNNLGFTYGQMKEFGKAFREFQRGGTEAEAYNNLGFAYEAAGDLKQAEESYAQALRIDPSTARARENLEHVARKAGHAPPEIPGPKAFGLAEKRNPDNLSKETQK
jgi:Flp pilus assembly protein TadD